MDFPDLTLTPAEHALIKRALAMKPKVMLSFGIGASIEEAINYDVREIVAVDSVGEKVEAFQERPSIKPLCESGRVSLLLADIGVVDAYGYPRNKGSIDGWTAYSACVWHEFSRRGRLPELVHVRGRFRVACGLSVGLAWPDRNGRGGAVSPTVILNDMSEERPHYAILREFYDIVAAKGSVAIARWKETASRASAFEAFSKYQFDPR